MGHLTVYGPVRPREQYTRKFVIHNTSNAKENEERSFTASFLSTTSLRPTTASAALLGSSDYGSQNAAVSIFGPSIQRYRSVASSSSAAAPGISLIKTEKDFDAALTTAQEKSLPAIFYFTAAWCGPCLCRL